MIVILDGSPWNTHILLVKDEEISTFWHGHRNRCFIFSCELSKKKKCHFLDSNSISLSVYNIIIIKNKEFNEQTKNKKLKKSKNLLKKRKMQLFMHYPVILQIIVVFSKFRPTFIFLFFILIFCFC